eukprot:scpid61730/ scgid7186/ 
MPVGLDSLRFGCMRTCTGLTVIVYSQCRSVSVYGCATGIPLTSISVSAYAPDTPSQAIATGHVLSYQCSYHHYGYLSTAVLCSARHCCYFSTMLFCLSSDMYVAAAAAVASIFITFLMSSA